MGVPGYALGCDLVVLAQELKGVGAGRGIVFLIGEGCCFAGCLLLHAEPAIDDGEDVVSGEIVGIDRLESLVLDASLVILAMLIEVEAYFPMGSAEAPLVRAHLPQIRPRRFAPAL